MKPVQTSYALAYAPSKSFLIRWTNDNDLTVLSFATTDEKGFLPPDKILVGKTPLPELFQPGDRLYSEMGGANGAFLLFALEKGVEVFQIPFNRLTTDDETGKPETKREARARKIAEIAQSMPEQFYATLSTSQSAWRIGAYIEGYKNIMADLRIKAQQRLRQIQATMAFLPASLDAKPLAAIRELLASPRDIEYYNELEQQMLKAISRELTQTPIWIEFLEEISGIGPSLAGRLIAGIGDIRRFPSLGQFKSYCGFKAIDGKMIRFSRGASAHFSPEMRQAAFLFIDQIIRQGEKCRYNAVYKAAKERLETEEKGKNPMHRHRMAGWIACSEFMDDLWRAWWKIIRDQGEPLPESVIQALAHHELKLAGTLPPDWHDHIQEHFQDTEMPV